MNDITSLGIDLTDRIQNEKDLRQSHKKEAIGTLAGGVAHEINNLLSIILGNAELAIDDITDNHSAAKYIGDVVIASIRAKEVVEKLLSVSCNSSSRKKSIQIGQVVEKTLQFIKKSFPPHIVLRSHILDQPATIHADVTEISQLLMHLCNNSVQAMSQGGGTLDVDLEVVHNDVQKNTVNFSGLQTRKYVKLSVQDTGTGIVPSILDRVFDPYFTTKEVDEGLGMGLALVKSIVDKHDGIIDLESKVGEGTKVDVFFPLLASNKEQHAQFEGKYSTSEVGAAHILVVDDEAMIVELNKLSLERYGYRVSGFTDPRLALDAFKKDPEAIDLIITDMAMPHMTGTKFSQQIKALRPTVPIILCTGYIDFVGHKSDHAKDIDACVTKPVVSKDLYAIIRELLSTSARNKK